MDKCTEDRFLGDVKSHEMIVNRDDRHNRHLMFRKPGTICDGFDLITWNGHLCIAGDCGTYVFSRIPDMFEFFRMNEKSLKYSSNKELVINADYWGGKLLSIDKNGKYKEFSSDLFKQAIKDYFEIYFEFESEDQKVEVWEKVKSEVLSCVYDGEYRAYDAAYGFKSEYGHQFTDFWESNVEEYTFHYIWCLYAIVWGIEQYDKGRN